MRLILRKRALFSDGTADYRMPPEPKAGDTVKIRFRTAADNVDLVVLCHEDEHIEMYLTDCDRDFDYYEAEIRVGEEQYKYHFEIISGMLRCTYDRAGVSRDFRPQYEFCIIPGFSTPEWAKGAVMYQIFTDRFCNGDTSNDVKTGEYYYINRQTKQVENWDKCPEDFDVANFYGGDLAGVLSKMDYLEELGVEVLYFNPLFVSASSHKYDTQDYDYIDPHFGVIVEDGGEPMPQDCCDNRQASLYKARVTNKKNLEASNQLLSNWSSYLSNWSRRRTAVACVSFWMACSITVDPLTNGWIGKKYTMMQKTLSQVLLQQRTAHTIVISISRMTTHFRII